MPYSAEQLRKIHSFKDLLIYLEEKLDWPLQRYQFDELTFEYQPEELGLKDEDAAKVKTIHQLRPLRHEQPWGIFFVEFENKKLPVVVLRRILSHLVIKKRASANKAGEAAWHSEDLMFITTFGEDGGDRREIAFAHFHQSAGDQPTLHVLGWDGGDTPLKLVHLSTDLQRHLRWPDDEADHNAWQQQWARPFRHKIGHVINTASALAEEMAGLARSINERAVKMLAVESEKGPLRNLYKAFQTALIHDLTEESFADTYAQTITYGLLTAAISRTEWSEGRHGTFIIAENVTDMVPITNPFLKEMLQTFLKVGGRKSGIDFDELGIQDVVELLRGDETDLPAILRDFGNRTPGEDPVIHFYEHFLSAYNKKLKIQRGVFYTPQPVVSYIIRSVNELLQTEFGLEDGLASTITWGEMIKKHPDMKLPILTPKNPAKSGSKDIFISPESPFVMILDIATGTGTFLVEIIDVIYKTMKAKWQKQGKSDQEIVKLWNEYVPKHLLPRLYGYELMMAPYAIAHMKIGLKLSETEYKFMSDERVRVYLTNSLEPANDTQSRLAGIIPALAHEAEAVNAVKRNVRFTVVVGNPPYSGISSNMTEYAQHIVDEYKFVDGAPLNEKKLWLQDDYVKFIRKAQINIETINIGVFGYITNHGYLNNPTFRGMRQSLMRTFPFLYVLDLHGNTTRTEHPPSGITDKNVFDIQQGVAICLASRGSSESVVGHADLWGTRDAKYSWLTKHTICNSGFLALSPDTPYYFFEPQNTDFRAEYEAGWKINEMMPVNCAGFITARDHFVVDIDKESLISRIGDFANIKKTDAEIRKTYFAGCGSTKYPDGDTRGWKLPEARKRVASDKRWKDHVRVCSYRPFDARQVYWADWMVDWPRPELSSHLLRGNNVAFHICRQSVSETWAHVLVARGLIDDCYVSNKSRERGYAHPLYLYDVDEGLSFGNMGAPNFSSAFLRALSKTLNMPQTQPHNLPRSLTPEDIFHYIYTVFYSHTYRTRYAEFLKIDFPRVPITSNLKLFCSLATLGKELVALHLLESSKVNKFITRFIGKGDNSIPKKPVWKDNAVWINATQHFEGVPENVWNFHIGGYQVCEKWLKDRKGRTLSTDDINHYQKIVVALSETIRIMAEIDKVIDEHGGWPGAFI